MKITSVDRYEIQAEAFRLMTGHMAPGKDAAPESYPEPYEKRLAAYELWVKLNGECVRAMFKAFENIIPGDDD